MRLASLVRSWWRPRPRKRSPFTYRSPVRLEALETRELLDGGLGQESSLGPPDSGDDPGDDDGGDGGGGDGDTGGGPSDGSQDYVTRLYYDLLRRVPAQAEVDAWATLLDNGLSQARVANLFVNSAEYLGNLVQGNYRAYLGREAEPGAIAAWRGLILGGQTETAVTAAFLGSAEFYRAHGASTRGWLDNVYGVALGRVADPAGLAGWSAQLQAGASRTAVAGAILGSAEARQWTVIDAYHSLLRRDPDAGGMASWIAAMQRGVPARQVAELFVTSAEYANPSYEVAPPLAPNLSVTGLRSGPDTIANNGFTNGSQLAVDVLATPDVQVMVFVDDVAAVRGRVLANGALLASLPQPPVFGAHQITARSIDGSALYRTSNTFWVTVDSVRPTIVLQAQTRTANPTPTVNVDIRTNDGYDIGAEVFIDVDLNFDGDFSDAGERGYTVGTHQSGLGSIQLNELAEGNYWMRARVDDVAGNEAVSATRPLVVYSMPEVPSLLPVAPFDEGPGDDDGGGGGGGEGDGGGGGDTDGGGGSDGGGDGGSGGGGGDGGGGDGDDSGGDTRSAGPDVNVTQTGDDHTELNIAVNPTNPNNLVIATHTVLNGGAEIAIDAIFTLDGGQTWETRRMDRRVDGLDSDFRFDPWAAFDANGTAYVAYGVLDFTNGDSRLIVARSTDGGDTYTGTQVAFDDGDTGVFNDKWILATGPAPGNPAQQNAYIAFVQFTPSVSPILVSGSEDGGVTWSVPTRVSDIDDPVQFACPAVGPNGEVYVAYTDLLNGDVFVDVSRTFTNGVFAFGSDRRVVTFDSPLFRQAIPAQPDRGIANIPVLVVDRSPGPFRGRLYLTYTDTAQGNSDPDYDIFLVSSADQGVTWTVPNQVNDDNTENSQFNVGIAVDQTDGTVSLEWRDARDDDDNEQVHIYTASSGDGGLTIQPNVRVSDLPSDESGSGNPNNYLEYDGIASFNDRLYFAWSDNSENPNGPKEVFFDFLDVDVPPPAAPPPPGGGGGGNLQDAFEFNDTSDIASNLGFLFPGTVAFGSLTVAQQPTGLPDYDWYRFLVSKTGFVTVTVTYPEVTPGDLHLRVFTLNASSTMIQVAASTFVGAATQSATFVMPAGAPLLIWVYGFNYAQSAYGFSVSLL